MTKNTSLGYVCCPVENRGSLLVQLLSKYWDGHQRTWSKKVVLVFCHDNSVKFHTELFQRLKDLPVMPVLKSNLVSTGGLDGYATFQESETGVLAVSHVVATRLPDLSADTIVQYEPPPSVDVVRQLSSACQCYMLFVRPQELGFVHHLAAQEPPLQLEEKYVPWDHVPSLPSVKIQHWYKNIHSMNLNSKAAYKAYLDSIRDHQLKELFSLAGVLVKEVAEGYCFVVPPYYNLVKETPRYELEQKRKEKLKSLPLPKTAKVIKTKYILDRSRDPDAALEEKENKAKKRIKQAGKKKKKGQAVAIDEVMYTDGGIVELGRNKKLEMKFLKERKKHLKQKKADIKGLKKQMLKLPNSKHLSKRSGGKRRRPIK